MNRKHELTMAKLVLAKARLEKALVDFHVEAQRAYPLGSLLNISKDGRTVRAKLLRHGTGFYDFGTLYCINTKTGKERKFYIGSHQIELISQHEAAEGEAA